MSEANTQTKSGLEAVIEAVKQYHHAYPVALKRGTGTEVMAVAVPKGMELRGIKDLLDQFLPRPERRRGTAAFTDLASFHDQVNRFKTPVSLIFADDKRAAPAFTAVFDYHEPASAGDGGLAGWLQHRAVYSFPLSDEWQVWAGQNGKPMNQGDFAAFIEDHIDDVSDPPDFVHGQFDRDEAVKALEQVAVKLGTSYAGTARLQALSRGLEVHAGEKVKQQVNMQTGERTLVYDVEHKDAAGAPVAVPGLFLIAIPVFRNGPLYRLAVRLRYRLNNGAITWAYEIWRADKAFDHAFDEAVQQTRQATGLPVLLGAPEK